MGEAEPTVQTSVEKIYKINTTDQIVQFIQKLIEEVNNFFDVEWQEKILLVEIIAFVVLIITAGILWTRNKKAIHRFIEYSTEHCNLKKEN
jgi:flagellar biosynthesis/type III secretory pathway M-ring protein FliF/YscJ